MRRRSLIGGLLAASTLAACDLGSERTVDGGASDDGGADGAASAPPVVSMTYGPLQLEVAVSSLVRSGEYLVLTLEVSAEDPEEVLEFGPVSALSGLVGSDYVEARQYDGIRLLDLDGDRVAVIATDAEGRSVCAEPSTVRPSGATVTQSVQMVYGDPGIDQLAVLIPEGGLLAGIPVEDGAVPEIDVESPVDLASVDAAPVNPLVAYSADLTTTSRAESSEQSTTVSLGADVLFDSSSAELTGEAQVVLEEAAQVIAGHEPGPVRVVGHTDSVDDEAANQTLSEQRAQAVADALAALIDDGEYPLEVSGAGESEPVADNGTEDGRALNRRVELSIDTPAATEVSTSRELPEMTGPVATGDDGVTLEDGTPRHVRATGARMVQGHLVVRVEFTRLDEAVDSAVGITDSAGTLALPTGYESMKTEAGIAVMDGPVATLPVWHAVGEEGSVLRPLTDLATNSRIDGGTTRGDEIVYPSGLAVGETVTIQLVTDGWRLTDIPVTD